ncbi:MAG: 2Fe-2S iron-sulfur cluster binding domain-containing protein [Bacteroidetes bacterium]|jgi:[NiFe] hydrogenase diaphorase moiety small subunit|nr:2Fe-2S iron-sulfur cluster binding domain-containing protein [Bacteroidota bacterium]
MAKTIPITINGASFQAEEGQNLVNAIRQAGVFVPSLCYYEHIDPPLGTCRVCTVLVNGKPTAACTATVKPGMKIVTNTQELEDVRKGMVEMLFAEGNHFCPTCEKSGDCDLQGLGYRLGVKASRFPHLFVNRLIDYRPERMVIDHNRCIRCRRCVEEVRTADDKAVFSFVNRGKNTEVAIDYDEEAKLSEAEAIRAMHICPVGAILVRGKSMARPVGERKYDQPEQAWEKQEGPIEVPKPKPGAPKKVVATTSLAGCFGCHMSLLDIDEDILDAIELVEFNRSPLTDIKQFDRRCDVGIIEGGCCNSENVEVLQAFRDNCDVLIGVGECAIWGGLPAMRNFIPIEECLLESYGRTMELDGGKVVIPHHEDLPELLDRVYGCQEVTRMDYFIPGCPPDARHIWKVIKHVLFGEAYALTHEEFKYD